MSRELYYLEQGGLRLCVAALGAELQSVRLDGHEYLWQGDARFWAGRAPQLFPYIARLTGGRYLYRGQPFCLDIHGFVKDRVLAAEQEAGDALCFTLASDEGTRAQYPFDFVYRVRYSVGGGRLRVRYAVENTGDAPMYFGLGGHPGFCVPMEEGLAFSDYALTFSAPCRPRRVLFSPEKFVAGRAPFALEEGRRLPLRHALFNDDAIVLENTAGGVRLGAEKGKRALDVECGGFRYVGLWHTPGTQAPFLCIEPWSSLPARQGVVEELTTQEDLICLGQGETYRNEWSAGFYG